MSKEKKEFLDFGPVTLGMIFLGFIIFGFFSYVQNPIGLFSTVEYPALTISVEYPGADVEDIEETITIPIEESLSNIGGVEAIHSFAERGKTDINIEFQKNLDLQLKSLEIRERIDILSSKFPRDVHKPFIYQYDPDQRPALILTLKSSKYDLIELRRIADFEIKRHLENVEGISRIDVSGGKVREIIVSCDMQKLNGYGLDLLEIQRAIQNRNRPTSIGKIENLGREFKITSSTRLKNLIDIQKIPIYLKERNKTIYIEDVANVSFSYRDEDSASRVNGNENISLYVYKSSLGNILELSNDTRKKLAEISISNVGFDIIYDQAESIKKTYWNLCIAFAFGLILYLFIFYKMKLSKGFRVNVVLFLQLLISFFTVQLCLFILKIPFDVIIFSGIVVGFAFWSVLSSHFILQEQSFNKKPFLSEFITFLSIIITVTVAPYLLDRSTGLPSIRLGLTTVTYLMISYVTFAPLIFLIKVTKEEKLPTFVTLPINSEDRIRRFINFVSNHRLSKFIKYLITSQLYKFKELDIYKSLLHFGKPILYLMIFVFGVVRFLNIEKKLYYSSESQKIIAYVELPSGTGFEFTNSSTKKIEAKIISVPGVKEVTSKIEPSHSFLLITLEEGQTGNEALIERIRETIGNTSPAFCYLSRESDASQFREITVDILGDENEKINEIINNLTPKVSQIPGVQEIILRFKPPRDELQIVLDKNKTVQASLLNDEVGSFLKTAIQGGVVTKFLDENREVDVRVRFSREYRNSKNSLEHFYLKNRMGRYIPLTEISYTKESKSPIKTYRKNKKRMLSFSLRTSGISHSEILSTLKEIASTDLPTNYQLEMGRNVERILENENRIYFVIVGTIIFIYMILVSYFESFIKPFGVLISAFVPVFLTFVILSFIFGSLTLPLYLGLLLLISVICFEIILKIKLEKTNGIKKGRRNLLFLFSLFIPQIFYSVEGGQFLQQLEATLILGYFISYFISFKILDKTQDKEFIRESLYLVKTKWKERNQVWEAIKAATAKIGKR